eukprot:TRINITY_DN8595_c0_g1_i1.p1 TRINITY_DN8595_c0_g1~~TRINITY_DN8595_c0_g1_i1.p1  ORF type:complete len:255 (-),score=-4.54 TRINITY_DN8595_c0_g1_i1:247-1011(-)
MIVPRQGKNLMNLLPLFLLVTTAQATIKSTIWCRCKVDFCTPPHTGVPDNHLFHLIPVDDKCHKLDPLQPYGIMASDKTCKTFSAGNDTCTSTSPLPNGLGKCPSSKFVLSSCVPLPSIPPAQNCTCRSSYYASQCSGAVTRTSDRTYPGKCRVAGADSAIASDNCHMQYTWFGTNNCDAGVALGIPLDEQNSCDCAGSHPEVCHTTQCFPTGSQPPSPGPNPGPTPAGPGGDNGAASMVAPLMLLFAAVMLIL